MKTLAENWKELFENSLSMEEMIQVRGGDDPTVDNPDDPIVK